MYVKLFIILMQFNFNRSYQALAINEEINFSKIKDFLYKNFKVEKTIDDYKLKEQIDINFISNNKDFKKICNENVKLCLLSLLDGRTNKESAEAFDKYFSLFEESANKKMNKNIQYGWVNATCQYNFTKQFDLDIDNLPIVLAYVPKSNKYALMYSSFEEDNINYFVESVVNGKVVLNDFNPACSTSSFHFANLAKAYILSLVELNIQLNF